MSGCDAIQIASSYQRNEVVVAADPVHLSQQARFERCLIRGLRAARGFYNERRERESEPEAQ